MAQSLANILVHLVYSTKDRRPLLRDDERNHLHAYISGILANHDCHLIEINSARDHIHVLFAQSKNEAPAKVIEQVKSSSTSWLKKQHEWYNDFAWQRGYGEFSVSPMHVESVRAYIRKQAMVILGLRCASAQAITCGAFSPAIPKWADGCKRYELGDREHRQRRPRPTSTTNTPSPARAS